MNEKRFSNLNLFTIYYPFTAIISFLHRVSGIFVFLLLPFLLWFMDSAATSAAGFENTAALFTNPIIKIILWLILTALWYHLIAGIRHLLMDVGFFEGLQSARISGAITLLATVILVILTGIWLW